MLPNLEESVILNGIKGTEEKYHIKLCGTCSLFENGCEKNTDKHDQACNDYSNEPIVREARNTLATYFEKRKREGFWNPYLDNLEKLYTLLTDAGWIEKFEHYMNGEQSITLAMNGFEIYVLFKDEELEEPDDNNLIAEENNEVQFYNPEG